MCKYVQEKTNWRQNKYVQICEGNSHKKGIKTNFMLLCVHVQLLQSCLTLCDPMDFCSSAPLSMEFSSKNIGVSCHALLQGIFLTQGLNPTLSLGRQVFFFFFFNYLCHLGSSFYIGTPNQVRWNEWLLKDGRFWFHKLSKHEQSYLSFENLCRVIRRNFRSVRQLGLVCL